MWKSDIGWTYGLIMTIGSVVGAYIASHLAVKKRHRFREMGNRGGYCIYGGALPGGIQHQGLIRHMLGK